MIRRAAVGSAAVIRQPGIRHAGHSHIPCKGRVENRIRPGVNMPGPMALVVAKEKEIETFATNNPNSTTCLPNGSTTQNQQHGSKKEGLKYLTESRMSYELKHDFQRDADEMMAIYQDRGTTAAAQHAYRHIKGRSRTLWTTDGYHYTGQVQNAISRSKAPANAGVRHADHGFAGGFAGNDADCRLSRNFSDPQRQHYIHKFMYLEHPDC